jgi:hypothetical protein
LRNGIIKWITVALLLCFAGSAQAGGVNTDLMKALIFPGVGQAQRGCHGRAAAFAGLAVVGGVGTFLTQIQYNQNVRKYDDAKDQYILLGEAVRDGVLVSYDDIENTYKKMSVAWDDSENSYKWRNVFLGIWIGSYALSTIDIIINGYDERSEVNTISVDIDRDSVRLVKTFHF